MSGVLNHVFERQPNGWYCGPAATRVALSARGILKSQNELAQSLGTTTNGTDSSNNVMRTLNAYLGAGVYKATFIGGNDASVAQRDQFRNDVHSSIDAGFAVVTNVVGSIHTNDGYNYTYSGGHYVCVVGYDDSDNVLVADINVREYWVTVARMATWIAGRGYTSSTVVAAPAPAPAPPSQIVGRPWPSYMPPNHYFGLIAGPAESHGGFYANEVPDVMAIQVRLQQLGYAPNVPGWADGKFEQPTADAVAAFQRAKLPGTTIFGQVWSDDWAALFADVPVAIPPTPVPVPPVTGTIFGVDLSDFDSDRGNNPEIVARYRSEGISFVTHKITEYGQTQVTVHRRAGAMLSAARDSGVPFLGGYIVARSEHTAEQQVAAYITQLDALVPWWRTFAGFFHQVDLERWEYDDVSSDMGNAVRGVLRAATNQPVLMYASKGQYGSQNLTTPRWNANYPSNAAQEFKALYAAVGGNSGPGWVQYGSPSVLPEIWQYSSKAIVAGQGTTDVNAFRGTEDQFASMLGIGAVVPAPEPTPTPPTSWVVSDTDLAYAIWRIEALLKNADVAGGPSKGEVNQLAATLKRIEAKLNQEGVA